MGEENEKPKLCRFNCGFYGSEKFDGMCSSCYKEYIKRYPEKAKMMGNMTTEKTQTMVKANPAAAETGGDGKQVDPAPRKDVGTTAMESDLPLSTSTSEIPAAASTSAMIKNTIGDQNAPEVKGSSSPSCSRTEEVDKHVIPDGPTNSTKTSDDDDGPTPKKRKRLRCGVCGCALGLCPMICRCGGAYCAKHRYSDKHDCKFDYRQMGANEIRRNNPVIKGDKVRKI